MRDIIIALICKNESQYLTEFIDYHFSIGFDKIIIADNNDVDGERYDDILADYIKDGKVVILDYRGVEVAQFEFYNHIINDKPFEYEWCAFIDTDEFITLNDASKYHNIKDFLKDSGDIKAYKVNWAVYGDNGNVRNDNRPVLERFKYPMPQNFCFNYFFPENCHIKSILHYDVKGTFNNAHFLKDCKLYYNPSGVKEETSPFQNIDYSVLYIRHFYTKSLEEWLTRRFCKIRADINPFGKDNNYPMNDFFKYNEVTKEKLDFMYEFFNYGNLSDEEKRKIVKPCQR